MTGLLLGLALAATVELPDFTKMWDFDHPDSTRARLEEVLPAARAAGDVGYLAELLTQIARTQALERRFAEAHHTLDAVAPLLRADLVNARVRYLLERGRTYNSSGLPAEGKPLFLAAWDLAREGGLDGLAVDAAHMVAIVETPEGSLEWNERAIAFAERSGSEAARAWLGSLYNNLGWTYHDMGAYEKALDLWQRGLAFREARGQKDEARIARWTIARCYRSMGRIEEALAGQEALLIEMEAEGTGDGYVHEEIGECLLLLHREAESRSHFARAYELLSQDIWMAANEKPRLERLRALGGLEVR